MKKDLKEYQLYLDGDDTDIDKKKSILKDLGAKISNVGMTDGFRYITIRCSKKVFDKIVFECDLYHCWMY